MLTTRWESVIIPGLSGLSLTKIVQLFLPLGCHKFVPHERYVFLELEFSVSILNRSTFHTHFSLGVNLDKLFKREVVAIMVKKS